MKLKKAIKTALKINGVTQYKLAMTMGVQPIIIGKIIKGKQQTIRREAGELFNEAYPCCPIDDDHFTPFQKKMFVDRMNRLRSE